MAPRKRKTQGEAEPSKLEVVTRRSPRLANSNSNSVVAKEEEPKKKKAKPKTETAKGKGDDSTTTIVIEHCKQCTQFKNRAIKVKEGLEKNVPGVTVIVNPEKPRRGCFEIREEGGDTFISLLDMKRPFGAMKALDMEQVITDIVEKIK